jgi:hypothetical protein
MSIDPVDVPEPSAALAQRVRSYLLAQPACTLPLSYQALAQALGLRPPHSIHRLILALEWSMREDAAAARPLLAALVISRTRGGLPAPGFFDLATRLGYHDGAESGPAACAFHAGQVQALLGADATPTWSSGAYSR